jgi:hypothetical protein
MVIGTKKKKSGELECWFAIEGRKIWHVGRSNEGEGNECLRLGLKSNRVRVFISYLKIRKGGKPGTNMCYILKRWI